MATRFSAVFRLTSRCNSTSRVRPKKRRGALIALARLPVGDAHQDDHPGQSAHRPLRASSANGNSGGCCASAIWPSCATRMPLVIGGDFNDFWNSLGWRVMEPAGFSPAGPSIRTFPARMPLRPLDKVFYRGDLRPLAHVRRPHGDRPPGVRPPATGCRVRVHAKVDCDAPPRFRRHDFR